MAQANIGEPLSDDCKDAKGLFLRPLDDGCDNVLKGVENTTEAPLRPSVFSGRFIHQPKKPDFIKFEQDKHVTVCDTANFMKQVGYFTKAKVKKGRLCPFYNPLTGQACDTFKFQVVIGYSESVAIGVSVTAPDLIVNETLSYTNQQKTATYISSPVPPPPWETSGFLPFGSKFTGTTTIKTSITDQFGRVISDLADNEIDYCGPVYIKAEATLDDLGIAWSYIAGQPLFQTPFNGCNGFVNREVFLQGFWLGVSYPIGVVGLVMGLSFYIKPVPEPDSEWSDCAPLT